MMACRSQASRIDGAGMTQWQRPPVVILSHPQMGENIGAAARAMKNCGLVDLRLVRPRDGWPNPAAEPMAASGKDILEQARLYDSLAAACSDISLLLATSARPRDLAKPVCNPREAAADILLHHRQMPLHTHAAWLFGAERSGLDNDELALADKIVQAPLNPAGNSLNLAQAVMVCGWEWRMAMLAGLEPCQMPAKNQEMALPASVKDRDFFFDRLEQMLEQRGFFTAPEMAPVVKRNLRSFFTRGQPSEQELRTLHGVLTLFDRPPRRGS